MQTEVPARMRKVVEMSENKPVKSGELMALLNEVHTMCNVWSEVPDFIFLEKLEIFFKFGKKVVIFKKLR